MKTISVQAMKDVDYRTIHEGGISAQRLMKRAGAGVASEIKYFLEDLPLRHKQRVVILCGKGNNGGDGYVVADILSDQIEVAVYSTCPVEDLKDDALFYARSLLSLNKASYSVKALLKPEDFRNGDIVVDALLGTGTQGPLRAPYDQWISCLNLAGLPVIAVDIPSGLNGDTGKIESNAVIADMTVAIAFPKSGMFVNSGPEVCGSLRCVDIGIPADYSNTLVNAFNVVTQADIKDCLQRLPRNSHKGNRGQVVTIAGSQKYKGAPILTGRAALCSGAGLSVVCVPESAQISAPICNSLILSDVKDSGCGVFSAQSINNIVENTDSADAIVIGPGLSIDQDVGSIIEIMCSLNVPLILDADALNLISLNKGLYKRRASTVLTPHPGEMKRLLDAFDLSEYQGKSRTDQALKLSSLTGAVVVLKGQHTVVASPDGEWSLNTSGTPALATAGSGDVLCGVIAAFLAIGMNPYIASQAGCFVHGLAAELYQGAARGLVADDLIHLIPLALRNINPLA